MNKGKFHPNAVWLINETLKFLGVAVVLAGWLEGGGVSASVKHGNIGKLVWLSANSCAGR